MEEATKNQREKLTTNWLNDFACPPKAYRPIPFFSWNEVMEPDEVRRQLKLFAEGGMGGSFMHSRTGLITPYLGDEWFAAADATIEESRRLGLSVYLYDEDKWPSGFSGGSVPRADKSFRMKALIAVPTDVPAPEHTRPIGPLRNGLQVYVWTSPLGHDWFNGTCYTDLMNPSAIKCFLEEAYASYHRRYGQEYGNLITAEFTDEPCTIFRSRLPEGAVPYTDHLAERFLEMHGYDPADNLHLLFCKGPKAPLFRLQYFRTINNLFENNFSRQLGQWCSEHHIDLSGHYMAEQSLYEQQLWGVKIMPNYRHQGIPGIDHLSRQIDERITAKQCHSVVNQYGKKRMLSELYGCSGGHMSFEDRLWIATQQMCLGVNLLNPHLALYTMAGCRKRDYPPNLSYQQPWWPLNNVIDEALARTCVALSQGRYHPEALIVHPQESTFVLWQSKSLTSGSAIQGEDQVWDFNPTAEGVNESIGRLDDQVKAIMNALLGAQRTFDFGDETIMAEVADVVTLADRPYIRIKEMDYPVVILPGMVTISRPVLELLQKFQRAGGPVLRCGQPPTLLDGQPNQDLDKWLAMVEEVELADLSNRLHEAVAPSVELAEINDQNTDLIWTHIRDLDNGERLIYLVNLDRMKSFQGAVVLSGYWSSVHHLDIWTGQQQEIITEKQATGLRVDLVLAPVQSYLLRLSNTATKDKAVSLVPEPVTQTIELKALDWRVERLDDNALTLDYAWWREGEGPWSTRPMPVAAIQKRLNELGYHGTLTLKYPVRVDNLSAGRRINMVVEHPDRYQTSINSKIVEYAQLPHWRDIRWLPIDVTDMLSAGDNSIELHCECFQHGDLTAEDPSARYGTEIEAIYLIGDFSVQGDALDEKPFSQNWGKFGLPPVNVQCFREHTFRLCNPVPLSFGDTTTQGLPFYAGRIQLTTNLPSNAIQPSDKIQLQIEQLDGAVAEIALDGRTVGHCISDTLPIDLTEAFVAGARELSIVLYGDLRNLLGPHHHIDGELCAVGPWDFIPHFTDEAQFPTALLRWMEGQITPNDWRERYCMVSFGNLGKIKIQLVKEKSNNEQ